MELSEQEGCWKHSPHLATYPSEGSRSVCLAKCFFREASGTKAKNNILFCKMCGLPWYPRAPKKSLGRKNTSGFLLYPTIQHSRGGTYGRILDFCFGDRTGNAHVMALQWVSRSSLICVLHHFSSLTRLKRSWGQVWPEHGPKLDVKFRF